MGEHSLDNFDRLVLGIIIANPKLSGFGLHEKLMVKWMGDSSIRKTFGWLIGSSVGRMYVSLAKLERFDLVASEWGQATKKRGWHRPRLYWSKESFASDERCRD